MNGVGSGAMARSSAAKAETARTTEAKRRRGDVTDFHGGDGARLN